MLLDKLDVEQHTFDCRRFAFDRAWPLVASRAAFHTDVTTLTAAREIISLSEAADRKVLPEDRPRPF